MRLIDAEQFVTEMEINIGNVYNPDIIKGMRFAIELINSRPTAFDKEKVIEELRQEAMYELGIPEKKFNSDKEEYSCYCAISFSQAKRIVEKGGIE